MTIEAEEMARLDRGTLVPSNAALVRRDVERCPEYDHRPATAAGARALLSLPAEA